MEGDGWLIETVASNSMAEACWDFTHWMLFVSFFRRRLWIDNQVDMPNCMGTWSWYPMQNQSRIACWDWLFGLMCCNWCAILLMRHWFSRDWVAIYIYIRHSPRNLPAYLLRVVTFLTLCIPKQGLQSLQTLEVLGQSHHEDSIVAELPMKQSLDDIVEVSTPLSVQDVQIVLKIRFKGVYGTFFSIDVLWCIGVH